MLNINYGNVAIPLVLSINYGNGDIPLVLITFLRINYGRVAISFNNKNE